MAKIQAIRGMHDILMQDTPRWQYLEASINSILTAICVSGNPTAHS